MTETERKALALVNEVLEEWEVSRATEDDVDGSACFDAICRAIEQHEAFRQEVSDAVFDYFQNEEDAARHNRLCRFIIPNSDPLVDVAEEMRETYCATSSEWSKSLTQALAARGLKITNI